MAEELKQRWLVPLLAGEIRSGFAMTEPGVASSDATNMQATCEVVGDEVVLFGAQNGATLRVETLADWADTLSYQIICNLGKRVRRVYKHA